MLKIKIVQGKGIGARIKKSPLIDGLKATLHEWLKTTAEQVKSEKLSGSHPFGGKGPPATGRYRKSIKARKPSGTKVIRGQIGSEGLDYPPMYEFGRSARWNKPVIRPIFRREQSRLANMLTNRIRQVLVP